MILLQSYLEETEEINYGHPSIMHAASFLYRADSVKTVEACYDFVCDEIKDTPQDMLMHPPTYIASDVLESGHSTSYGKSNLLNALLRACSIPVGFCYFRKRIDSETGFMLHSLIRVQIEGGEWVRLDCSVDKEEVKGIEITSDEKLLYPEGTTDGYYLKFNFPRHIISVRNCFNKAATTAEILEDLPDIY